MYFLGILQNVNREPRKTLFHDDRLNGKGNEDVKGNGLNGNRKSEFLRELTVFGWDNANDIYTATEFKCSSCEIPPFPAELMWTIAAKYLRTCSVSPGRPVNDYFFLFFFARRMIVIF